MKELKKDLTSTEATRLAEFLDKNGPVTFIEFHGLLTACAGGPLRIVPEQFIPPIFGNDFESEEIAKDIIGLALRLYDQTLQSLSRGSHLPLLSSDIYPVSWPEDISRKSLSLWCRGYIAGVSLYLDPIQTARSDPLLGKAIFSIALFDLEDEFLVKHFGLNVDSLENLRQEIIPEFPIIPLKIYNYWQNQKLGIKQEETFQRPGRDDPCACGSGRKYKQCCLH